MTKTCIIIGASHGGGQAAISLRQSGWDGDILLIGEEPVLPYHRPPLSKDFLQGGKDLEALLIRPQESYETANITTITEHQAVILDREHKVVHLKGDHVFNYDKLILAMGARPRPLPIPGADLEGVFCLRNADDVMQIKASLETTKKAVIIGGGYIGLETAASLKKLGVSATVLEATPRILQRVTAPLMSDFYRRVHGEEGVEIIENCAANGIEQTKDGLRVKTSAGAFDCELVIVGIGVIPNTELAERSGLEVSNGIVVDDHMQTSDPDIYACGDMVWHYNKIYDRHIRLESVPNATDQAKIAAANIAGGDKTYNALPWFWSDQFDLKLQMAGLSDGYDDIVVRGDSLASRSFAAFYFAKERLIAVDAVNRPQEYMFGRKMIPLGKTIDKKALADEETPLKSLMK